MDLIMMCFIFFSYGEGMMADELSRNLLERSNRIHKLNQQGQFAASRRGVENIRELYNRSALLHIGRLEQAQKDFRSLSDHFRSGERNLNSAEVRDAKASLYNSLRKARRLSNAGVFAQDVQRSAFRIRPGATSHPKWNQFNTNPVDKQGKPFGERFTKFYNHVRVYLPPGFDSMLLEKTYRDQAERKRKNFFRVLGGYIGTAGASRSKKMGMPRGNVPGLISR